MPFYGVSSDPSHQQQDDKDQQDHADETTWTIAPATAIGPRRNGTDEKQNDENEQDGADCHEDISRIGFSREFRRNLSCCRETWPWRFGSHVAMQEDRQ